MKKRIVCVTLILLLTTIPLYADGNELHIGWSGLTRRFDPAQLYTTQQFDMSLQLFEGVTVLQPGTLTPQPGVATHWDISADKLTYTFYLRPDAVWADGTPITADTFKYSWLRALEPDTASPYASFLFYITNGRAYAEGRVTADEVGIEVISSLTLRVTLTTPAPFFLQLTALPVYMPVPEHIIQQYGESWTTPEHLTGNGPFRIAGPPSEERFIISRNPS
jgi:ABC-type oligopeptide transport system substrate-binding subunit